MLPKGRIHRRISPTPDSTCPPLPVSLSLCVLVALLYRQRIFLSEFRITLSNLYLTPFKLSILNKV